MSLPGNTDLSSYDASVIPMTPLKGRAGKESVRSAILLASNDANDVSLFLNGLTQNILILYDLFESLGYDSYLLQTTNESTAEKRAFLRRYRAITPKEVIQRPMPITALIEIGMSLDAITRGYLRSVGTKIVKLYLGNILNIDVETVQACPSIFFYHHLVGEIDEIWTSPHYKQHLDYAALLNQTERENARVVPYVWDPCFLTQYGSRETMEWIAPSAWETSDMVIMDPNISFQKCYFYSLLLAEAFARRHPEWKGKVVVVNGDRILMQARGRNVVLPSLSLYRTGRLVLTGRKNIHTILKENRSACFLTHQWNNDFNYMTLELLYCRYPLLHNSEGWKEFGYSYSVDRWEKALETLYQAMTRHAENLPVYQTHAANLLWKHSIHHPTIQAEWRALLSRHKDGTVCQS